MTYKRKLTLPGNRNHKKGGSKKTSWVWNLMEQIEITNSNGAISKNALCNVNISETPDVAVSCGITIRGGDFSTSNYNSCLMSAHGMQN